MAIPESCFRNTKVQLAVSISANFTILYLFNNLTMLQIRIDLFLEAYLFRKDTKFIYLPRNCGVFFDNV